MKTALAVSFALFAACVDGRRENIKVHEAEQQSKGAYTAEQLKTLAETLDEIHDVFEARAKKYNPSKTAADSLVFNCKRRAKDAQYGTGNKIYKEGWDLILKEVGLVPDSGLQGLEKTAMEEAWKYLAGQQTLVDCWDISADVTYNKMSAARVQVLEAIYEHVAGGVDQALTADKLTCSKDPDSLLKAMGGSPINFDEFKRYYNKLGMMIANDGQFVLMLVNAWHFMEGNYAEINTVNLRVRCYVNEEDDVGEYLAIIDDCQRGRPVDLIKAQTGKDYYKCEKSAAV